MQAFSGVLPKKYLLDTHIILWAALDVKKLSRKAKKLLEAPDNLLCFSPVSLWEISIKHAKHPDQMPITSERAKELALKMGFLLLRISQYVTCRAITFPTLQPRALALPRARNLDFRNLRLCHVSRM